MERAYRKSARRSARPRGPALDAVDGACDTARTRAALPGGRRSPAGEVEKTTILGAAVILAEVRAGKASRQRDRMAAAPRR